MFPFPVLVAFDSYPTNKRLTMRKLPSVLSAVLLFILGCFVSISSVTAHDGDGQSLVDNAPVGSGGSGPFDAVGVCLLSHLELDQIGGGGSVFGSDCWGWTDTATNRKFALFGLSNGTSFVEVTDPTNPLYLGKLDTTEAGQNRAWRDVKVHNDHAFIVADGGGNDQGIQAFDLQQLLAVDPASPQSFTATSLYTGFASSHNIVINEATGHGYVVGARDASGGRLYNGGLTILDLNDPTNITEIGDFRADGYTHDAQVVMYSGPDTDYTGQEIVFASNEDTLTIVRITDDGSGGVDTIQISRNPYAGSNYSHQGWLSTDQTHFYMNDELDEYNHARGPDGQFGTADDGAPIPTKTHIWNVEDLDNPLYEGFFNGTEKTIDHNLYIKGDLMYQANYTSGMRILRIDSGDSTSLSEVGYFDTYSANNNVRFDGAWSVYPFFDYGDDDVILISDQQGGLFLVKRIPAPTVTAVELNTADVQRSAVESISLSFDGDVIFGGGAVSVVQRSTATEATFQPVTTNVTVDFPTDQTRITIQFDSHVRNSDNALVDGNYQITLAADLVTRDGVAMVDDYVFGGEETDGFFSYYGDSDGDRNVNIFDLLAFRQSYGSFSGGSDYDFYFDYGADGAVNVFDLLQFRIRYGKSLPFTFGSSRSSQTPSKLEKRTLTTKRESGK